MDSLGRFTGKGASLGGSEPIYDESDGSLLEGVEIYGTEFTEWFTGPKGLVVYGNVNDNSGPFTSETGQFHVRTTLLPFRVYRIGFNAAADVNASNILFNFRLRMELGPDGGEAAHPTVNSPELLRHEVATPGGTNADFSGNASIVAQTDGTLFSGPRDLKILLTGSSAGGQNWNWRGYGNGVHTGLGESPPQAGNQIWVEDLGPLYTDGGDEKYNVTLNNGGGGTPPSSSKTYQTVWTASTSKTYRGNGSLRTDTTDMVQGTDPSGYNGNGYAYAVFANDAVSGDEKGKTVAEAMTGATLLKVEVFLYFSHWYHNSGGTAVIRPHNSTSIPSSAPSGASKTVGSWPNPGGRWVNITNVSDKNIRGISLGKGPTSALKYYGRAGGADGNIVPRLRLTYEK